MPITRSAIKALRQSKQRHTQNLIKKDAYKRAVRLIRNAIEAAKVSEAAALLPRLYQAVDKAAKRHVIKKNKAARIKSRLTKLLTKPK